MSRPGYHRCGCTVPSCPRRPCPVEIMDEHHRFKVCAPCSHHQPPPPDHRGLAVRFLIESLSLVQDLDASSETLGLALALTASAMVMIEDLDPRASEHARALVRREIERRRAGS